MLFRFSQTKDSIPTDEAALRMSLYKALASHSEEMLTKQEKCKIFQSIQMLGFYLVYFLKGQRKSKGEKRTELLSKHDEEMKLADFNFSLTMVSSEPSVWNA